MGARALALDGDAALLAIETATARLSVALLRGDTLLAARHESSARPHSETLLPAIDAVLAEAGVPLAAVGAFALAIGPGSFTGLRVGLATLKGLVFATPRPVLAVPTLAALAAAAPAEAGPALALLDARRGELYAGHFARPGLDSEAEGGERLLGAAELAEWLPVRGCVVAGEGARAAAEAVLRGRSGALRLLEVEACAVRVGRLAARMWARGGGADAAELVPRYGRRAEAEVRRTGLRERDGAAQGPPRGALDTPPGVP